MSKVIIWFLFLFSTIVQSENKKEETVAILTMKSGSVKVQMSEKHNFIKASVNMALLSKAKIKTEKKSWVRIKFVDDGTDMLIPEDKIVSLEELLKKRNDLKSDEKKMKLNQIKTRLFKNKNPDTVPTAVAGVRGTDVSKQTTEESKEFIWDE